MQNCTVIVDVGKTNARVGLWSPHGELLARRTRANSPQQGPGYRTLDIDRLETWLIESLREFAGMAQVVRIATVGHGAAAALIRNERLFCPVMDYEDEPSARTRDAYAEQRDAYVLTGSPWLPAGLNLGMQLHHLEEMQGPLPQDVTIVPWPQYWAFRLSGVLSSEVSSLGCHTDLWWPLSRTFSQLAVRRGWAARMAPLRHASAHLGAITAEIVARTGLPANCSVLCGMHDSNAALLAARGHREMADEDATVLSTGTWFVAMRSLRPGSAVDPRRLNEHLDCLINVDVHGEAVPSARFMGGREAELLGGVAAKTSGADHDVDALLQRLRGLIAGGAAAYPSFVRNVGPFPRSVGQWRHEPADQADRRAVVSLYLALMADATLGLIGSCDRLLIEGRFAQDVIFTRALAALRPQQRIFVSDDEHVVAYGALRLIDPELPPSSTLSAVEPLPIDLGAYAGRWRVQAAQSTT